MKKNRLKISKNDFEELKSLVFKDWPLERGAFALAGINTQGNYTDILVRRIVEVPQDMFRLQNELRLEIHPKATNGLIALCEVNNLCAVICHSHPKESGYSTSDDYGEKRMFDTISGFLPDGFPMISLLLAGDSVKGRVWTKHSKRPIDISEIIVIGNSIEKFKKTKAKTSNRSETLYNRQILAFGSIGQKLVQETKVGIVGVGGTGSPIAEQLVRLGVNDLVIVDKDILEQSNLTRMYGTYQTDFSWWQKFRSRGLFKASIVKSHLQKINPKANILAIQGDVVHHENASRLLDRDVIFLCTDEHWGRSIVNQIAYQYLIPTINLGLRIDSDKGIIKGAAGGVDILTPDKPCLWCRGFLSSDRIHAESLPKAERKALLREGYVEDIDTPTPSVINFTSTLASLAVTQFLQLITDFNQADPIPDRMNYFIQENEVSEGNVGGSQPSCICKKHKGFGELKSLNTLKTK